MSSKIRSKKWQVMPNRRNTNEEEIIEIGEFIETKNQKKTQRKNEITEISSSESTTPNKKEPKKQKFENETNKIMDIEIPLIEEEKFSNYPKNSVQEKFVSLKKKKSVGSLTMNNIKKNNEKNFKQLISKKYREKPAKIKEEKGNNITLISLDESDNDIQVSKTKDNEEVKIVSEEKNKLPKSKRKI